MLARGGSAVDAMVAVNAALGVVYPHMTGVGGDAFWLIHDAATGRSTCSTRAGAPPRRRRASGTRARAEIAPRGPRAALTVPARSTGGCRRTPASGACRSPTACARDRPRARRVPARRLAGAVRGRVPRPARRDRVDRGRVPRPGGAPPRRGDVVRLPRLADTLEAIAATGRGAFYEGEIAAAIAAYLARAGGVLTAEDFAAHRSDWVEPARVRYRGRTAVAPPPNSQGFAGLQILGMLEHVDVAALAGDPAAYVDVVVRATALAFEDRDRHLCDPDFGDIPLERLLDPAYLAERAARLDARRRPRPLAAPRAAGDTTFSCAVDADGNAAAVIQSIYQEWGSGVVAGDTGVLLQNRGCFFSLDPEHPNCLAPGKRTAHTLTAAMLIGDARPRARLRRDGRRGPAADPGRRRDARRRPRALGRRGGRRAALAARPHVGRGAPRAAARGALRRRRRRARSRARGHENVSLVEDWTDVMGHAQAIQVFAERLEAAADPRGDGAALGL